MNSVLCFEKRLVIIYRLGLCKLLLCNLNRIHGNINQVNSADGSFQWVNGDAFQYTYFDCNFNQDGKQCLKFLKDKNGMWTSEDCNSNMVENYICQRGTSSAQFWQTISGAEFAHFEHECIQGWQNAVDSCETFGGKIASIVSQTILDELQSTFSSQITQNMWIGLNDVNEEGTLTWYNGEEYLFTAWSSSGNDNDDSRDCVSMDDSFKYNNETCNNQNINGYMCIKGTAGKYNLLGKSFIYRQLTTAEYSIV